MPASIMMSACVHRAASLCPSCRLPVSFRWSQKPVSSRKVWLPVSVAQPCSRRKDTMKSASLPKFWDRKTDFVSDGRARLPPLSVFSIIPCAVSAGLLCLPVAHAAATDSVMRASRLFHSGEALLLLVYDVVASGGYLAAFRMLLYERVDVPYALLLEYLVDGYQYASLLHIADSVVDGCA